MEVMTVHTVYASRVNARAEIVSVATEAALPQFTSGLIHSPQDTQKLTLEPKLPAP